MNNVLLYRWLALPFWLRLLLMVFFLTAGAMTIRYAWLQPLQLQIGQQARQLQQETQRYRLQRRNLRQRSSLHNTEADITSLQQALRSAALDPFSLLQLSEAAGNHLQSWQPAPQGGEIILLLDWPQLQSVFRYLSERQPAVRLSQFSLKRADQQLRLKLVVQYAP